MENYSRTPAEQQAVKKLLAWQPEADDFRFHKCSACKKGVEVSYRLPADDAHDRQHPPAPGEESCGYYCGRCGFSGGGSRKIESEGE